MGICIPLLLVGLAACLPIFFPSDRLSTNTPPPPTNTSTPTIVWFPPTPTYTALPTITYSITPSVEIRPDYGELVFYDNFSDPTQWDLGKFPQGNIALGVEELTLAISQPRGYLFSLRQGTKLGDFYVEVSASPSICRGDDEYGLLLRVSPSQDFFRFGLICNGQARVDRYLDGLASSPKPPSPNGAVPPGAPSTSRMAVWVMGKDMHFYVNDQYLFSVRDPSLTFGGLGVFARAAGEDIVTVNFSDLVVYEVSN